MKKLALISLLLFSWFTYAQDWQYNFEESKQLAAQENKNIIMIFSGSDWCAPCIRLEKNIWQSEEFKAEAEKKWVLLKLNFPRKKSNQLSEEQTQHNRNLAEKYNRDGSFPLVIVMQPDGKVLGKFGFKNVSAEDYIKMLNEVN